MKRNTIGLLRGGPGRKKGVPNKVTVEVREFAEQFINNDAYKESLTRRILRGSAPHMETLIWQYRYGKPKDVLDLNLPDLAPLRIVIEDAHD